MGICAENLGYGESASDWADRLKSWLMEGVQISSKMLTPRAKLQKLDIIECIYKCMLQTLYLSREDKASKQGQQ